MKDILLSICIPTHNRIPELCRCLDSIVSQKEFADGLIEVLALDNASTDETYEVMKKYAEKYPHIRIFRNDEGMTDERFPYLMGMAEGELIRLCNDTLVFEPGSLRYMCELVRAYAEEKPYLYFSAENCTVGGGAALTDFSGLLKEAGQWLTFIGALSLWNSDRDEWLSHESDCETKLWQVVVACEKIKRCGKVIYVKEKLTELLPSVKKTIDYGIFDVIYTNFLGILTPYVEDGSISPAAYEEVEKKLLFGYFFVWCFQWEIQNRNLSYTQEQNLKKKVRDAYRRKPYWPAYVMKYNRKMMIHRLYRVYCFIRRKEV